MPMRGIEYCGSRFRLRGELEELPQLKRHDVDARRKGDNGRGSEQRDGVEEHDDRTGEYRRCHERQRYLERRQDTPCSQDLGCLLHLRRDHVEGIAREDEHVGERVQRRDQHQSAEAVDVERPGAVAGERHPGPIQPAGIRPREKNPGDRAQVGRCDEGAHDDGPNEALAWHIGARDRKGDWNGEADRDQRHRRPVEERVQERGYVSKAPERQAVVGEREGLRVGRLETRDQQAK